MQWLPMTTKSAGLTAESSSWTSTVSPASKYSRCRGITTKPSARLNAVTDPEPLPRGKADKVAESLRDASSRCGATRLHDDSTSDTNKYSVRPRSELTRMGSTAEIVAVV